MLRTNRRHTDAATSDEGGTQRVRTVMGLSKTSTSIGWVLVDERDAAAEPLDHDAFDITDARSASPAATARRVRDIATASGFIVDSVHVTSSGNVTSLRDALADCGFDDVVSVPLAEATRSWARDSGYADALEKTAICMLGRDSASLSIVETRSGAMQSTTTTITGDIAALTDWLNFAMGADGSLPEALYLIGSRSNLDDLAGPLDKALSVPVIATRDAQTAIARGAASSDGRRIHIPGPERSGLAVQTRALAVVAAVAVVSVFTLSAAGSSIPVAESKAAAPTVPPERTVDIPVAPMVFPPPAPSAAPQPVVSEPQAAEPVATAITPDAVAPEAIPAAVPQAAAVAPPVEHLPDPLPVEHLPEAPTGPAPGPDVPAPPPPPPPDPFAGVLSPLFGGLP